VRDSPSARFGNTGTVKRQLFLLVVAVVVVDALFIAGYFLFRLRAAGNAVLVAYTAAWTAVTLLVVLYFLTRIRSFRRR
jgi:hypothetical protein